MRLLILDPETARGASWLLFKGRSLGVTYSSNLGSLISCVQWSASIAPYPLGLV